MEAIRQIIDSNLLNGVISLPKDFQNKKVEVIVLLTEEKFGLPQLTQLTMEDIDEMLKGSVTESLIGILPNSNKTLEEYQAERLSKYERID